MGRHAMKTGEACEHCGAALEDAGVEPGGGVHLATHCRDRLVVRLRASKASDAALASMLTASIANIEALSGVTTSGLYGLGVRAGGGERVDAERLRLQGQADRVANDSHDLLASRARRLLAEDGWVDVEEAEGPLDPLARHATQ